MKEQIYTIPVTDGFNDGGECPFCNMYKKLDKDAVDYMLGPSYMEDDIRFDTNKIGFCKDHYHKMYHEQNRLGLALMLHTHIQQVNKDLQAFSAELKTAPKKSFFSKQNKDNNKIIPYLNNISNSCYICNKIDKTFARYIDTFFYMWTSKPEFKNLVKESKGFCLEHFNLLIENGEKKLKANEYEEFLNIAIPIQIENLKRLEDEVEWFTNKFDYKYADQPWKTSKDALPRALLKISSIFEEE